MNEQRITQQNESSADSAQITPRQALDHPATRAAIAFWQRYRKRNEEDTRGLPMFVRLMEFCMGEKHHVGYSIEKWSEWSREPLWFSRRDFQQWPRYIEWVTAWYEDENKLPDGVESFLGVNA